VAAARVPAIDGWFTVPEAGSGEQPALIGTRCRDSGTYFFPPERVASRAPGFFDSALDEVRLSSRGRLWSYTDAGYRPPEPYVPVTDPHEPFCIAAVELEAEKIVVMGQVVAGVTVEDLRVGMEMELVVDTLYTETDDDGTDTEYMVWKWRPVDGGSTATQGGATQGGATQGGRS
jgi:hypothetical protein